MLRPRAFLGACNASGRATRLALPKREFTARKGHSQQVPGLCPQKGPEMQRRESQALGRVRKPPGSWEAGEAGCERSRWKRAGEIRRLASCVRGEAEPSLASTAVCTVRGRQGRPLSSGPPFRKG